MSAVKFREEAVRMLSYSLPCPLPSSPDPRYVSVGASTTSTHQGRLPSSAANAPSVAHLAGQQLSPAITTRCNSDRPNAGVVPVGSRDGVTTTIHSITSAIQRIYGRESGNRVLINVNHAHPPHIPLNRLPSIPPDSISSGSRFENLFGSGVSSEGGGGYFAPPIFNTIVVAPRETPGSRPANMINPILPPNSLHFSILERFIPPTSMADDQNMFSPTSSILTDRLFELSEYGGSLLFVYPTKTGAKQFVNKVLGPVLDPLLRKLMVLYGLREDVLWRLRTMTAVETMAEWDTLKKRVESLCKTLSTSLRNPIPVEIAYTATANVRLNEDSWREWWSQQEQMRIREIVKRHFANMSPTDRPPAPGKDTQKMKADLAPLPRSAQAAINKRETGGRREQPPTSIDLSFQQSSTPSLVTPLSPEASAHYLGIRNAKLPTTSPIGSSYTLHPSSSNSPSPNSSSGFTMGYGAPGDLSREVIDGVRARAVRPSSRGMGEAVMASALAGSGGNTAVGQGMGGVVGEAVGRKEGSMNRRGAGNWGMPAKEQFVEVGVFVLRRIRVKR